MKDLRGKVFNSWTFINFQEKRHNHHYWLVRCSCGTEAVRYDQHILLGKSTKCRRCKSRIQRISQEEKALRALIHNYQLGARVRELSWDLTKEQVLDLVLKPCSYCAQEPPREPIYKRSPTKFRFNGLDRKDNTQGYTTDNTVPCCSICNKMKGALDEKVFLAKCASIVSFMCHAGKLEAV